MIGRLNILEIASQPWCWLPELDGIPARGGAEYIQPLDHSLQSDREAGDGVHRHFSYSFVAATPDVSLDRIPVDIRQLAAVLSEIEGAVFAMICGQSEGTPALRRAGEALSRLIMPAWVLETLFSMEEGLALVIRPDELAAAIPFELCYHQRTGRFLSEHLAVSRGIASRRRSVVEVKNETEPDQIILLHEGVVVHNPDGDPRLNCRTDGITALYEQLSTENGGRVVVHCGSTFPEMLSLLGSPLFLYTGHIRFDSRSGSFIECADQHRLLAAEVGYRLKGGRQPALAILNGCGGDRTDLDPGAGTVSSATRSSFARNFYEAGVQAVVGARWEVDLDTAWALNRHLIAALTGESGQPIGEVLRRFRLSGAPGWPCYVMYGDPRRSFRVQALVDGSKRQGAPVCVENKGVQVMSRPIPSFRHPLVMGLLLDTSKWASVVKGSDDPRVAFLKAVQGEIANLDARLAPNSGKSVCRLVVEGWPNPVGRGKPVLDVDNIERWLEDSVRSSRPHLSFPGSLMKLRDRIRRETGALDEDIPPPLIVILLAPRSLIGSADVAEAVRICDELRNYFPEGTTSTAPPDLWAIACDPAIPQELLVTLAGGEPRRTGRLLSLADGSVLAESIFEEQRSGLSRRARGSRVK